MTDIAAQAPKEDSAFKRFFSGRSHFDFIGRSRLFLYVTIGLLALCALALIFRGLNFSLDFTGGTGYTVTGATKEFTAEELQDAIAAAGVEENIVQLVDEGEGALISTTAVEEIGGEQQERVINSIAEITGVDRESIAATSVGPRWGQQISSQALRGLIVFLIMVALYITLRFEWRMAVSALVTLVHDIVVSVGLYSLVGFEISPASVIAFLTILGYSLYDTVVVFDRVKEDTAPLTSVSSATYGESANRALNEVLVRSLSTTATAILPVGSLLFIGARLLGAETLQDLALALFIGMTVGAYSSIVIATPILVWLKEKEPRWAELKTKVESRRRGVSDALAPAPAAAAVGTNASGGASTATGPDAKPTGKVAPKPGARSSKQQVKRKPRRR